MSWVWYALIFPRFFPGLELTGKPFYTAVTEFGLSWAISMLGWWVMMGDMCRFVTPSHTAQRWLCSDFCRQRAEKRARDMEMVFVVLLCFTCSVCPPFSSRCRWEAVVSTYRVNPQDRWWSIRWSWGSITRSRSTRNQRYQMIKSSHCQAGTLPLLWVNSSFDGQLPQPWPQSGNADSQGAGVNPGVDIRYDI